MLWNVNFEIGCRPERLKELCNLLNTHRCVILAKPVVEQGDVAKGGVLNITRSPNSNIECNAQVLHQSEEDNLVYRRNMTRSVTKFLQVRQGEKASHEHHRHNSLVYILPLRGA